MLGFSAMSSAPFGAIIVPVGVQAKLPVEILSTIRTVVEQLDMPIDISVLIKRDPKAQQWILKSQGKQWVIDSQTLKWLLNSQPSKWIIK